MLNGDDPPPSLHGHYPASTLLRGSPPLSGASVLSASRLEPLAPCMGLSESSRDLSSPPLSFFRPLPLFDRGDHPFVPTRASLTSVRRSRQSWPSHTNPCGMLRLCHHTLTASSPTARLVRSGWRSEGSPLSSADQSRHNLVSGGSKDPNHDAAMRIGSEAPKRRTHSFPRHNSHGTNRDPPPRTVIGDRHKRTDWAETVGCLQQPPFIAPGAERRRPAPRPLAQAATRRSEACAPRPRS